MSDYWHWRGSQPKPQLWRRAYRALVALFTHGRYVARQLWRGDWI